MDLFTTDQLEAICSLLNKCSNFSKITTKDLEDFRSREYCIDFNTNSREFELFPVEELID